MEIKRDVLALRFSKLNKDSKATDINELVFVTVKSLGCNNGLGVRGPYFCTIQWECLGEGNIM